MNGLRIYIIAELKALGTNPSAFFSRRDNGPFYQWTMGEKHWSVARVSTSNFSARNLSVTSWKLVPAALQKSIIEHYQD